MWYYNQNFDYVYCARALEIYFGGNMKEIIEKHIKEFVKSYKTKNKTVTSWEEPLIAYAYAKDPLFYELKREVSSSHSMPADLIEDAKTIITYFIPFSKDINTSNIKSKESSAQWSIAYIETNKLILEINKFINIKLTASNYDSTILPPTHNFDEQKLISDWSHKHVAYIAGLGKFGLHKMLITQKGCSGRLGSIVTNLKIEPTTRSDKEYCLYNYDGTCQKCVDNCVSGALKIDSFDRNICYKHLLENAKYHSKLGFADACGKCVSKVPCSFINPVSKIKL